MIHSSTQALVLKRLRADAPISRRHLSELTGLQPPTISNVVGELLENGLLEEVGKAPAESADSSEGGRPQVLLRLKPGGAYVAGVHLGVNHLTVAIADHRGTLCRTETLRRPTEPDAAFTLASKSYRRMLAYLKVPSARVTALGVAAVSMVDPLEGTLLAGPELGWNDVSAAEMGGNAFDLPTAVDSNYRSMMLAEAMFGAAKDARNAVLLHVGATVGLGMLVDRRVVYGDSFRAGRLGHAMAEPDGPICSCGSRGCLNAVVGEAGVIALATSNVTERTRATGVVHFSQGLTLADIHSAALRHEAWATDAMSSSARSVASVLTGTLLALDPEVLIVAGSVIRAGETFLGPLRKAIDPQMVRVFDSAPRIQGSAFAENAHIAAAVSLALDRFIYRPSLPRRSWQRNAGVANPSTPTRKVVTKSNRWTDIRLRAEAV